MNTKDTIVIIILGLIILLSFFLCGLKMGQLVKKIEEKDNRIWELEITVDDLRQRL